MSDEHTDKHQKRLIEIEYFVGSNGFYDTYAGPLLVVDHELSHEEAMSYLDISGDWEIAGVYTIDSDPLFLLRCPHCGFVGDMVASEMSWEESDSGALLTRCPECNESIDAEEMLRVDE